jgi:hypothetical protein
MEDNEVKYGLLLFRHFSPIWMARKICFSRAAGYIRTGWVWWEEYSEVAFIVPMILSICWARGRELNSMTGPTVLARSILPVHVNTSWRSQ